MQITLEKNFNTRFILHTTSPKPEEILAFLFFTAGLSAG
jgi:hypothetical protein